VERARIEEEVPKLTKKPKKKKSDSRKEEKGVDVVNAEKKESETSQSRQRWFPTEISRSRDRKEKIAMTPGRKKKRPAAFQEKGQQNASV